jgi:hypothetical protein
MTELSSQAIEIHSISEAGYSCIFRWKGECGETTWIAPVERTSLHFSIPPEYEGKSRPQNHLGFLASDDAQCLTLQMQV